MQPNGKILIVALALSIATAGQAQSFQDFLALFAPLQAPKTWTSEDLKQWAAQGKEVPADLKVFFVDHVPEAPSQYLPLARIEQGKTVILLFSSFTENYSAAQNNEIHIHSLNFDASKGQRVGVNHSYIFSAGGEGIADTRYEGKMETDAKNYLRIEQKSGQESKKAQYKITKKGLVFDKYF